MFKGMPGFLLAVTAAVMSVTGCSTLSEPPPVLTQLKLDPIDKDAKVIKGMAVRMTERREDGAWSVTYLSDDRFGRHRSRVVVTDWTNEQHYDVPRLAGVRAPEGQWMNDGRFILGNPSFAHITLAFQAGVEGGAHVQADIDELNFGSIGGQGLPLNFAGR